MKKSIFKFAALILSLVLITASLAGCGKNGNNDNGSNDNTGNSGSETSGDAGTPDTGKFSFSYMLPGKYLNWLKDLSYWPDIQEKSGVSIELVNGGDNDDSYYQNVDLQLSAGGLSDAAIVRQAQSSVYGSQGAFKDLKPLIEQYAPNLKKYIEDNPDYAAMITSSDGAIYGIGVENPLYTNLTFYRADHFEKAGITQLPTTLNEFTEDLRKLKETFSDVKGYYPWVGRDSYLHFAEIFDALDYIDDSGKVHGLYNNSLGNGLGYDIYAPGFREMIEWYQSLYKEGLIDPAWVSGTGTEEEWQTKYLMGQGSISDDFFTRPTWFMSNGGPDNDPDYDVKVMDLFKTNSGGTAKRYFTYVNTDRYLVIPEASKNEEGVMTFLNWLYSEEGQEVMHYGIDGVNTVKESDGSHTWKADFAVEAVKPVGETNYGVYQDRLTFPYPVDNKSYYESLDSRVQEYCADYFNQYADYSKQIIYTEQQSQDRSNLLAKYETEFTSDVLDFVNGTKAISDENWNEFLQDMEKAGYSDIHNIDQAAYDAMKK